MATGILVFDTKNCVGCKTCAIACSYHHRGVFSLAISSIEIKGLHKGGKLQIAFHEKAEDGHLACDKCKGEKEPFCVKYCNFLARGELKDYLDAIWKGGVKAD